MVGRCPLSLIGLQRGKAIPPFFEKRIEISLYFNYFISFYEFGV
jgi:hypothetical protein